eukprot:Em0004g1108a
MSFLGIKICCNPLKLHKKVHKRDQRPVAQGVVAQHPSLGLTSYQYICTTCRKELKRIQCVPPAPTSLECMDDNLLPPVDSPGETRDSECGSICSSDSRQTTDCTEQDASSIDSAGPSTPLKLKHCQMEDAGEEMIRQLKEKFHSTTSRSERMRVLTVLPQSWSIRKVFGVSRYLVAKVKQLVAEKGILSSPNPKGGMPEKKDFVSVL